MHLLTFLNYIIFNKDGQRNIVWNEFMTNFRRHQSQRWAYLKQRNESV